MTATFDCQTCGACCFSPWTGDGYVRLYEIDIERLLPTGLPVVFQTQENSETITKLGTRPANKGLRACVGFAGGLGRSCSCTIYELRPEACRHFEVGGALCREARQRAGLPVEHGDH